MDVAMEPGSDQGIFEKVHQLLLSEGIVNRSEGPTRLASAFFSPIGPDGSTRRFWRLALPIGYGPVESMMVVAPQEATSSNLAEAESVYKIGTHLKSSGVNVPEIWGWDSGSGIIVFEDLGDVRLHDMVLEVKYNEAGRADEIVRAYHKVLDELVIMQVEGGKRFTADWCWDTPRYDASLMVEKESNYFLKAFWQNLLALEEVQGIHEEFVEIARRASMAPADFFLHRDFQSRNIMIKNGTPWFIDFQGGRLGPLGYDVASLLIDPYSGLTTEYQEQLYEYYVRLLCEKIDIDRSDFGYQYNYLALQRNLQIVGAFSFLYKVREKVFFKKYIVPSLKLLVNRLHLEIFQDFPLLKSMVLTGLKKIELVI